MLYTCSAAANMALALPGLAQKAVQPQGKTRSRKNPPLFLFNSNFLSLLQITGGSSGIGKAVAREALLRGAAVVTLLARDEASLSNSMHTQTCPMCVLCSNVHILQEKLKAVQTELERLVTAQQPQVSGIYIHPTMRERERESVCVCVYRV